MKHKKMYTKPTWMVVQTRIALMLCTSTGDGQSPKTNAAMNNKWEEEDF